MEPLLKVASVSDDELNSQNPFDLVRNPKIDAKIFDDSDDDYTANIKEHKKMRKHTSMNEKLDLPKFKSQSKPEFHEFDSNQ